jgi:hypothetical protein
MIGPLEEKSRKRSAAKIVSQQAHQASMPQEEEEPHET